MWARRARLFNACMPIAPQISVEDVVEMVRHWISTPVNGYLGSDYGVDRNALLQNPLASGVADDFISKLRSDIPLLAQAPAGAINLYSQQVDIDKLLIVLEVYGQAIEVGTANQS